MITKVNKLAYKYHLGQFRKNGKTPYITHPLDAQRRAISFGYNDFVILASLALHDTIEDVDYVTPQLLVQDLLDEGVDPELAVQVGDTVVSLTNSDLFYEIKSRFNRKTRRKLREAHYKNASTRSLVCKVFDCHSNIHDMDGMSKDFGKLYKEETKNLMLVIDRSLGNINLGPGPIDTNPAIKALKEVIAKCEEK